MDAAVRTGEFAEVIESGNIVGSGSFFFGQEQSKRQSFAVYCDHGLPLSEFPSSPVHSFESRCAIRGSHIANILSASGKPEIRPSIVKRVSIAMVYHRVGRFHDHSMNTNSFLSRSDAGDKANHVERAEISVWSGMPLESADQIKIIFVNQCILAARELKSAASMKYGKFGHAGLLEKPVCQVVGGQVVTLLVCP